MDLQYLSPVPFLGAKPVFCDIDPDTLLIDVDDLRAKITDKTACICAVHLWGNVCDMDALMSVGEEYGIPVLEDCSHAHGAQYKGRMCGAIGQVGCWSLQGSKPVSAGEGGVVTTDDVDVFERACLVGQVNRIAGIDLVGAKYEELQPLGFGIKFPRAPPLGIGIAKVQFDKTTGTQPAPGGILGRGRGRTRSDSRTPASQSPRRRRARRVLRLSHHP